MVTFNRNRRTDIENKLTVIKEKRGWGSDKLGVWNQEIHTTVYKIDKQCGPTVQHRENYIQYLIINHNGKEYEKGYIYV